MGEDLTRANKKFEEVYKKVKEKVKKKLPKDLRVIEKGLFYLFFLEGFKEGSGETQIIA
ncbi:MAG TPA: hypothetical protein VGB37_15505 [Candidatus Lokiarchaeia archaeon]